MTIVNIQRLGKIDTDYIVMVSEFNINGFTIYIRPHVIKHKTPYISLLVSIVLNTIFSERLEEYITIYDDNIRDIYGEEDLDVIVDILNSFARCIYFIYSVFIDKKTSEIINIIEGQDFEDRQDHIHNAYNEFIQFITKALKFQVPIRLDTLNMTCENMINLLGLKELTKYEIKKYGIEYEDTTLPQDLKNYINSMYGEYGNFRTFYPLPMTSIQHDYIYGLGEDEEDEVN